MTNILLATPAGDCQFHGDYIDSLRETEKFLAKRGYGFDWGKISGCSEPTIARALIAHEFLKSNANVLVGIDADQGWNMRDLKSLIDLVELGEHYVAAPVVTRSHDHYEMLREAARYGKQCELYERHNFEPFPNDAINLRSLQQVIRRSSVVERVGRPWLKVPRIGTGMFAATRTCFERMREGYPELTGKFVSLEGPATCFYPAGMLDGVYRGEDIGFCERWRKLGGSVWMLVNARTRHWSRGLCFTSNVDESVKTVVEAMTV